MDDDEKMDEDKEKTDNEEIGDEEQEEEHQKAGALLALTFQADVKWKTTT